MEDEDEEQLEQIAEAVVGNDKLRALFIAASMTDRSFLNPERRSLQILGCEDRVIVNLPLGDLFPVAGAIFRSFRTAEVRPAVHLDGGRSLMGNHKIGT